MNPRKTGNRKCWHVVERNGNEFTIVDEHLTRKDAIYNASKLIRGMACLDGYHFEACRGEAHNPDVGGMIDNCGVCAPEWGWVMVEGRWPYETKAGR